MLKQHKNAFLDVIQDSGLDPTLFSSEEKSSGQIGIWDSFIAAPSSMDSFFAIYLKTPRIRFCVVTVRNSFDKFKHKATRFHPGLRETWWSAEKSFDETIKAFKDWLSDVAGKYITENDLPDYWSQVEMYKSFASGSDTPTGEGERFTDEEKEDVRNSINKFHTLINENFNPTPEQAAFIDERLEYLSRATDRLNRFDWNGLAISVVVSIAVNLSVDTERGRVLFNLFKQAFQSAMRLLQ